MTRPIHAAILGASGYGAGELLRLLTQHPAVEVTSVTSTSQVGERIATVHPHLRAFYDLPISAAVDYERLLSAEHAVVFSALPNGASGAALDNILRDLEHSGRAACVKLIDLSGDLRLHDTTVRRQHYPETPELATLRQSCIYGLPELCRDEVRRTRLIANPGCLASAAILALAPLLLRRTSDGSCEPAAPAFRGAIAIDATTGSSGSGRQLKETTHHPTRHADYRAYKPLAHQHEPEILQALGDPRGERLQLSFVPHSTDAARGIAVTAHVPLPDGFDPGDLAARYAEFYEPCPFVRLTPEPPSLQNVVGSNFCDIAVATRGRQVVAMAALDNLVKGMAGTAIQNMNLMCGLPETTGLWFPAMRPV
ncbi:MAG: N-acetyl-gamma-glutamyl-phosphate reductase [Planctomycetota bacterium]